VVWVERKAHVSSKCQWWGTEGPWTHCRCVWKSPMERLKGRKKSKGGGGKRGNERTNEEKREEKCGRKKKTMHQDEEWAFGLNA